MPKNVSFWLALRYFGKAKKSNFIHWISRLSVVGITVGTMALVVVLSVFNGLEDLIRSLHRSINADLKIMPVEGKSFELDQKWLNKIKSIDDLAQVVEVIEDHAVLKYRNKQIVVFLKAVSDNYPNNDQLSKLSVLGNFTLQKGANDFIVIGRGIQYQMTINLNNPLELCQLWYPKRLKKINLANLNPETSFNQMNFKAVGSFAVEQQYDDSYVFIPLRAGEELMDYQNRRSAIEIQIKPNANLFTVQSKVQKFAGKSFKVLNRDQQQASLLRAIQIEKLFVYITFSFILAIAAFNIFFSLTMLAIEKEKDIAILKVLGTTEFSISAIFFYQGVFLSLAGACSGLLFGVILCILQEKFGFIGMGTESTIVKAYPVKILISDLVFIAVTITSITVLFSYLPAQRASKIVIAEKIH